MKQLSGLDSAFLYLETESSPMHIGGVSILEPTTPDGPFTLEKLKALMASRLHTCRTFTEKLVDVPLSISVETEDDVNWLTSCGTMHDFDLPQAYLRVELEDPDRGELAVIRRDELGGVAWRVWQIRAE